MHHHAAQRVVTSKHQYERVLNLLHCPMKATRAVALLRAMVIAQREFVCENLVWAKFARRRKIEPGALELFAPFATLPASPVAILHRPLFLFERYSPLSSPVTLNAICLRNHTKASLRSVVAYLGTPFEH